jgi:ADP-heptose:LPS heptosyltransferase
MQRIVISRTDKIGDLVLSIASFYRLRQMYPNAEITVLVRHYNADIVRNLPYINQVLCIDDFSEKELILHIQKLQVDAFVALYSDAVIMRLARASGAKIRIGNYSKWQSFFTYNKGLRQKRSESIKNECDYNLDLVRLLDANRFDACKEVAHKVYLQAEHISEAERFLAEKKIEKPFILIHPFTGGSSKNITDAQYFLLLDELRAELKLPIVVSTSHAELDRAEVIVKSLGEGVFLYENARSILFLGGLMALARVFTAPATGTLHLAASLGARVVGLYPKKPSMSPTRWGVKGAEKALYIIPDEVPNAQENYKHKNFDSYDFQTQKAWVEAIKSLL